MDVKRRLIQTKAPFVLLNAAPEGDAAQPNWNVNIRSAKLYVRTKKVSSSLIVAHEQMLQTVNYKIPYTKVQMKTITIPQGLSIFQCDNLYLGNLPDRIADALVHDEALAGSFVRNPFNFHHYGLNYLCLKVGGDQIPRVPLEPNFADNDFMRESHTGLEALGYDTGPNC